MIKIDKITKIFADKVIYRDFSLDIKENRITGILGGSGIGKTTLINMISGIWPVDSGQIIGLDSKALSFIFQEPRLLPWMTVFENLEYVLKNQYKDEEEIKSVILSNLSSVDMLSSKDLYPKDLSGGMLQRVSIARAFAFPSHVLIMDEPFKGLDINLKKSVMDAFKNIWCESRKTVIFVTHDIDEITLLSDTVHIIDENPVRITYTLDIDLDINLRDINTNCKDYKDSIIKKMSNYK